MTAKLVDFIPEFTEALTKQIEADQERWGDTWLNRPRAGQAQRVFFWFRDKLDKHRFGGQPFPWTKLAGEALIGWVRDNHPDLFPESFPDE